MWNIALSLRVMSSPATTRSHIAATSSNTSALEARNLTSDSAIAICAVGRSHRERDVVQMDIVRPGPPHARHIPVLENLKRIRQGVNITALLLTFVIKAHHGAENGSIVAS